MYSKLLLKKVVFKVVFNANQGCIYLITNTVKQLDCEILLEF